MKRKKKKRRIPKKFRGYCKNMEEVRKIREIYKNREDEFEQAFNRIGMR